MANAYATRAEVDSYFSAMYATTPSGWTGTTVQKDAALLNASRWLDITFGPRWVGEITSAAIALGLDWPRTGYDNDGSALGASTTPEAVKQACAEAAALYLAGSLDSLPDRLDSTARVVSESLAAGSVSKSVTYLGGKPSTAGAGRSFPKIEGILRKLLNDGGGTVPMEIGL